MTAQGLRLADERLRDFSGKAVKSACYAPFVSLYLTTSGSVQACCRNQTFTLGNLNQERLTDIWNGGRISTLRKALTEYKFGLGCSYCEWESERRGDSFAIRLMSDHLPVTSADPEWPSAIEFNGSNICNLECIMCGGDYSSAIRANVEGLPPLPKVYDDRFFEDLRLFLPHLRFINFLGGEPFLAAENRRVWDMMVEEGLSIPCRVTTNGTQFNARTERALQAVPMHVTVSLDGVTKETYESIRHRANFETVIANLHKFHAYTRLRGTTFGISFCLMRQNWRELGDMVLFAEQLDCELNIAMVASPSYCSLFTLRADELRSVVDEIARMSEEIAPKLRRHRKALQETVQHLNAATDTVQVERIREVIASDVPDDAPLIVARRLCEAGSYEDALLSLATIQAGSADRYFALALSGEIQGRQGDSKAAVRTVEEALRLSRKLPDAYLQLARIRLRQGESRAALQNALLAKERVVPEDRLEAQVLMLLGVIYAIRWRLLNSCRVFARMSALPPGSVESIVIPDSPERAREVIASLTPSLSFRMRCAACCVYALFNAARIANRALNRIRQSVPARHFGKRHQGPRLATGEATALLLPSRGSSGPGWTLRVAGVNNKAQLSLTDTSPERVRIQIEQAATGIAHEIQLNCPLGTLRAGSSYWISFEIRTDQPRAVRFGIAQAGSPWSNIGLYRVIEGDTEWTEIRHQFACGVDENNARLHFDLGDSEISVEIASPACNEVGNDELASQ